MNRGKIVEGLKQALETVVHPGRQPMHIKGDAVIISIEQYERMKGAETRDKISKMDDGELKNLVERQIKAAGKIIRTKLPRVIKANSPAGVSFGDGFDDVIAEALIAAKLVD